MNRNIPIYHALKQYYNTNPTVFHMPGHKMGKGIPKEYLDVMAKIDVTEIPGTDNLHYPEKAIKEAQELAAKAFGADRTFFLVNGSTCGIHAAIMTVCSQGAKLIVPRDCHKSVIGGLMLAGANPVYIKTGYDKRLSLPTGIAPTQIEEALKMHPDAAGVLITRPNYYGICADIQKIADIVHAYGKVLLVDEAHGAHFKFSDRLPMSALDGGADMCIQSAHKTLPALTQGSYLHIKSTRVDLEKLQFYLRLIQTTSPSYLIMTFLDIAREMMETTGKSLLDDLEKYILDFYEGMEGLETLVMPYKEAGKLFTMDVTRVVINVKNLGITGFEADRWLRNQCNIQVEMSDFHNITCISTICDRWDDFDRLSHAMRNLCNEFKNLLPASDIYDRTFNIPEMAIELKEAGVRKGIKIKYADGLGRICKSMITPYPPGIPLVCPGEVITGDMIAFIQDVKNAGGVVNGVDTNDEIEVVY